MFERDLSRLNHDLKMSRRINLTLVRTREEKRKVIKEEMKNSLISRMA